jgi:hypothetical protein
MEQLNDERHDITPINGDRKLYIGWQGMNWHDKKLKLTSTNGTATYVLYTTYTLRLIQAHHKYQMRPVKIGISYLKGC